MSGIDNILPDSQKIKLFGEEYSLRFNNRTYAAIEKKFGKSPIELLDGIFKFDINCLIAALWGGSLEFDKFDPADPIKIKREIELEKLYEVSPGEVVEALKDALLASQVSRTEGLAEDDQPEGESQKKTEIPSE